jgi:hypothetical protein
LQKSDQEQIKEKNRVLKTKNNNRLCINWRMKWRKEKKRKDKVHKGRAKKISSKVQSLEKIKNNQRSKTTNYTLQI